MEAEGGRLALTLVVAPPPPQAPWTFVSPSGLSSDWKGLRVEPGKPAGCCGLCVNLEMRCEADSSKAFSPDCAVYVGC